MGLSKEDILIPEGPNDIPMRPLVDSAVASQDLQYSLYPLHLVCFIEFWHRRYSFISVYKVAALFSKFCTLVLPCAAGVYSNVIASFVDSHQISCSVHIEGVKYHFPGMKHLLPAPGNIKFLMKY